MKVKLKDFIKSPYGLIILISWIALIICLIIKLFGGNWFQLWLNNDKFIAFCNYVDETIWLKRTLACLLLIFGDYFILCIAMDKSKLSIKELCIFIPLMILKSITGWYILWLSYIIDLFILILIPIILSRKWKRVIVINIVVIILQFVTILLRNVNSGLNSANTFIEQFLIQIDYYIMLILIYLYNNKKIKAKEEHL